MSILCLLAARNCASDVDEYVRSARQFCDGIIALDEEARMTPARRCALTPSSNLRLPMGAAHRMPDGTMAGTATSSCRPPVGSTWTGSYSWMPMSESIRSLLVCSAGR